MKAVEAFVLDWFELLLTVAGAVGLCLFAIAAMGG
jgi:hypothetical protein